MKKLASLIVGSTNYDELVMDDQGGISKHQVMRLSFTYDHRLIDGAVAAKFVMALRDLLEKPMSIIL